jgi:hypothetical protein
MSLISALVRERLSVRGKAKLLPHPFAPEPA